MIGRGIAFARHRWPWSLAALAAASVAVVTALSGGGGSTHRGPVGIAPAQPSPAAGPTAGSASGRHLSIGLTEANANLLWSPTSPGVPPGFGFGRLLLTALHPSYLRVILNWDVLQPAAGVAPRFDTPADGCARGTAPCGQYAGLRSELAAIASQQHTGGGFEVVMVIAGAPSWAAHPPQGCERPGTTAYSRPIRPEALAAYRALIRSVLALGRSMGVAMPWWAPWNEPNHPAFVSPQRAGCSRSSPSLSPGVYAGLERSMAAELRADGPGHRILLGELSGLTLSSPRTTSIAEFVADLPADVVCASDVWSVHAYAGTRGTVVAPVTELESALDARGACGRRAHIWVTETGAGGVRAGGPRAPGRAQELTGCRQVAALLDSWYRDPRIDAAFQYEFREDSRFAVGLITAPLDHLYPVYYVWRAWGGVRPPAAPPALPAACT